MVEAALWRRLSIEAHRQGLWLRDALREFADPELRTAFDNAPLLTDTRTELPEEFAEFAGGLPEGHRAFLTMLGQFAANRRASKDAADACRHDVRSKLIDRRLLGFGLEPAAGFHDAPILTPVAWWFGQIGWRANRVDFGSRSLIDLRIIERDRFDEIRSMMAPKPTAAPAISGPQPPLPKTRGAPSSKATIDAAIERLVAHDLLDIDRPKAAYYALIRTEIGKIFPQIDPEGRGYSDEAIRKRLKPFYDKKKTSAA